MRAQDLMPSNPPASHGQPVKAIPGVRYVGESVCTQCHSKSMAKQRSTAMAKALESVTNCEILRSHPRLTFRKGVYSYEIVRQGNRSLYKVNDGATTIAEPILWCFGRGGAGQTYVFEHNGSYYQSRVSFYNDIQGLDLTFGVPNSVPASLDEAAGAPLSRAETRSCFACHSTGAIAEGQLKIERLTPGVSCEACHGPGQKHVDAIRTGKSEEGSIFNPRTLNSEEMANFCGSCHRTWEEVASMHIYNINNVRFQPYGLINSRCYEADDRRISCTACHNPHEDPKREPAFYDAKCVACHSRNPKVAQVGKRIAVTCKVGTQLCVTCHMAKHEIPGTHFKFTDHRIRIVKAGERYPN
jgi:Zn finger protein HypA/HybF involved in hydrogenase expression